MCWCKFARNSTWDRNRDEPRSSKTAKRQESEIGLLSLRSRLPRINRFNFILRENCGPSPRNHGVQCESHHVFTKVFVVTRPVFKQTSV
jgi:hypothetical protein